MHRVDEVSVTKAISFPGENVLVNVAQTDDFVRVRVLAGKMAANDPLLVSYIREWFDLDKDISPFYRLLAKDKKLAYMPEDFYGLRLLSIPDLFEALIWSIIGQQINLTFAYKLKRRLTEAYGTFVAYKDEQHYLFPLPEALAAADKEALRAMQFSERKAEYVTGIAQAFASGNLSKEKIAAYATLKERQQHLSSFRGIGVWTTNYALMKSLKERSCIPYGDAGLLNALVKHEIIREKNEAEKIDRFFKKFRDWESYLVFYLWRSLTVR